MPVLLQSVRWAAILPRHPVDLAIYQLLWRLNSFSVSCNSLRAWWAKRPGIHPALCFQKCADRPDNDPQNLRKTNMDMYLYSPLTPVACVSRCPSFHFCYTRLCETGQTWPSVSLPAPQSVFSPRDGGGKSDTGRLCHNLLWHNNQTSAYHSGELNRVDKMRHSQVWIAQKCEEQNLKITKTVYRMWCQRGFI